ncbi:putative transposase [Megasphaera sp. NM10]|nr:putative transposase [Megasphaera sp. NM10]
MVMDDHSRFNLSCHAQYGETFGDTIPVMRKIFLEYGMPKVILCDNGNPWGTVQSTGFTKYEVWMMERGVLVIHGRIKHPQTQGKQERMNQTFRKGCIQGPLYKNLRDAQSHFDAFGILQQQTAAYIAYVRNSGIAVHIQPKEISPQDSFLGLR